MPLSIAGIGEGRLAFSILFGFCFIPIAIRTGFKLSWNFVKVLNFDKVH